MTRPAPLALYPPTKDATELSPEGFDRFATFITNKLGIKMPESKSSMVQSRLSSRVRELQLGSLDKYADYLFAPSNSQELEHFINAITTNKTEFFREREHFTYLLDAALPALRTDTIRGRRFNAWSAGCSSGEEPYTLAMVLAEHASRQSGFDFAILATDVSTKVLRRAKDGVYTHSDIQAIPPDLRRKYLLGSRNKQDGLVRVVPDLRARISFHQLNFMDESYEIRNSFHAIFFRNVMIYFDRSTQEAVLKKICRTLAPGGYLFAGHSESLTGLDLPLQPVKASIYRKPA